jgi:hypothetical protein
MISPIAQAKQVNRPTHNPDPWAGRNHVSVNANREKGFVIGN